MSVTRLFNHLTLQSISLSSHLFPEKNSLNSYVSHPTLFVILIPFLHLFLNNVYLYSSPVPTITDIVNLSLSTGVFPKHFKLSSVIPLLKKYNLDKEELSNYRPIFHLSFLSKLTERVVKQRLTHHLSSNHLLNSFQSAYTTHHSTESLRRQIDLRPAFRLPPLSASPTMELYGWEKRRRKKK